MFRRFRSVSRRLELQNQVAQDEILGQVAEPGDFGPRANLKAPPYVLVAQLPSESFFSDLCLLRTPWTAQSLKFPRSGSS